MDGGIRQKKGMLPQKLPEEFAQSRETYSGTTKVRNSGLGPDPDLSAKSGPE